MRVIEPYQLNDSARKHRFKVKRKKTTYVLLLLLVLAAAYSGYSLKRTLPVLEPVRTASISVPAQDVAISWPKQGQAAIGAHGYGILATSGAETAKPMASITKVMTALAVLKKHPLDAGQQGPSITINAADVQSYYDYVAKQGSVVPINLGEEITQFQALQALLIPSSNNIADTLARWAFGSVDAYVMYANALAKEMGLKKTIIGDASGFSPKSVSTPSDLVKLGLTALSEPVVAEIVKQRRANIPMAGTVLNTNKFAGKNDVIGIKTGHTDESGGCFLLAATHKFGENVVTVVGAVMGDVTVDKAQTSAVNMLPSIYAGFGEQEVLKTDEVVGYYTVPWAGRINIITSSPLNAFNWLGYTLEPAVSINTLGIPQALGADVGDITLKAGSETLQTDVQLADSMPQPSVWWRLTHPF